MTLCTNLYSKISQTVFYFEVVKKTLDHPLSGMNLPPRKLVEDLSTILQN